jgi:hypothetical protein
LQKNFLEKNFSDNNFFLGKTFFHTQVRCNCFRGTFPKFSTPNFGTLPPKHKYFDPKTEIFRPKKRLGPNIKFLGPPAPLSAALALDRQYCVVQINIGNFSLLRDFKFDAAWLGLCQIIKLASSLQFTTRSTFVDDNLQQT